MALLYVLLLSVLSLSTVFSDETTIENNNNVQICSSSTKESDSCVTVKFPWRDDDVYFCPDQEYKYTAEEKLDDYQCSEPLGTEYMKVDAAWLDCPKILETDRCAWYDYYDICYEAPYNRPECKDVSDDDSCCPDYYCGPGETWDDCEYVECPEPPADVDYTEFYDYYSCCPGYQVAADEKPGQCPDEEEYDYDYYFEYDDFYYKKRSIEKRSTYDDCIGDFNCPGEKKCCAYYGDYGYCTDPVDGSTSVDNDVTTTDETNDDVTTDDGTNDDVTSNDTGDVTADDTVVTEDDSQSNETTQEESTTTEETSE